MLHPATKTLIDSAIATRPHAIIFYGEAGVGVDQAIQYYIDMTSGKKTDMLPEKNEKIDLDDGVITIDQIRTLHQEVRTKTVHYRVVVVHNGDRMSPQAQNAFLKLLEEPGTNITFIISAQRIEKLLPTVRSRAQAIQVHALSDAQTNTFLDEKGVTDPVFRRQLLFMARGLIDELTRLIDDTKYFDLRADAVRNARAFISGTVYEKLRIINSLQSSRRMAIQLIDDAIHQLRLSLLSKTQNAMVYMPQIERLFDARMRLEANGNIRLAVAAAVL